MAQTQNNKKPERGDLIEIFRGSYQHWAIYIGDDLVVHVAVPPEYAGADGNSMMFVLSKKAVVKKQKLLDVVGTNDWRINNFLDKKHKPREIDIIVKEALGLVGHEVPYGVLTQNCEHFVTKLRNGIADSVQVDVMLDIFIQKVFGLNK